jgi:hypothetical protein
MVTVVERRSVKLHTMATCSSSDTSTDGAIASSSSSSRHDSHLNCLDDLGLEWEDEDVDYGKTRSVSSSCNSSTSTSRSETFCYLTAHLGFEEENTNDEQYRQCSKKQVLPCTFIGSLIRYQKNREPTLSSLRSSKVLRQLRVRRMNFQLLYFFVLGMALLHVFYISTRGILRVSTLQQLLRRHAQLPSSRSQKHKEQVDFLQHPQYQNNEKHRGLAAVLTLSSNTTADAVSLRRSFPFISEKNSRKKGVESQVNVLKK